MSKAERSASQRLKSCVLVLGTEDSGTSDVASLLGILGCQLPQSTSSPNQRDIPGTVATSRVREFNDEVLASAGSSRDDFTPFYRTWLQSPRAPEFLDRAVSLLEQEFGDADLILLSDPGMCQLLPFWSNVLERFGCECSALIVTRDPSELGQPSSSSSQPLSEVLWLHYMLEAESGTRGMRRMTTSVTELLNGWEGVVGKAQDALQLVWPKSTASVEFDVAALFNKARFQKAAAASAVAKPTLPAWLAETADILSRWAEQGENPSDYPTLDRIRAEFDVAASTFARVIRGAQAYGRMSAGLAQNGSGDARTGHAAQVGDAATLKSMLQEQRRKTTLLNADLHKQIEAREALETQLIEAQAELEASRDRRKEMARVISNRDAKIQRLYEELAALQRHIVRSGPLGQIKVAFRRIGRSLRRSARRPAPEASTLS